jgi:hypothetical protein
MALAPGKHASTLDLLWDVAFMPGCLAGCDTDSHWIDDLLSPRNVQSRWCSVGYKLCVKKRECYTEVDSEMHCAWLSLSFV